MKRAIRNHKHILVTGAGFLALALIATAVFVRGRYADAREAAFSGGERLKGASSAYLREAAGQPVNWYPWGAEAFARARKENKPILLDIGAIWCHWCHVMDRENYDNPDIARIINEHYIAIKVDRDERPDVDARYQQTVSAVTGSGGWPLTAFLTPNGDVFFGGTYFPPEDRFGRPGFPRILRAAAEFYRQHEDEARSQGAMLRKHLAGLADNAGDGPALRQATVDSALADIRARFDPINGGFGGSPKFPSPTALDLLFRLNERAGDDETLTIITKTLTSMGRGGVYDQIGGGFHRYATDERWVIPHFEKMLYDNAGLLRNYVWAYALTRDPFFRDIALGIMRFADGTLSDRVKGGFYSSQDADTSLHDDGGYFTWSLDETKAALTSDELAVAARYYDIGRRGEMTDDSRRNVLHVVASVPEIARETGLSEPVVRQRLSSAKAKLAAERRKRKPPFVDRAMYVAWNGMMVVSYLDAARFLDAPGAEAFALATLDRMLAEGRASDGTMKHAVGEGEERSIGTLDDQVQTGLAALAAYQATGERRYLDAAKRLAAIMRTRFWDERDHGFFDTPPGHANADVPLLSTPHKPIFDSPVSSGNGSAIQLYRMLWSITEDGAYRGIAEETARAFGGIAQRIGMSGAAYILGIEELISPPPLAVVVGPAASSASAHLRDALLNVPRWGAMVTAYDPARDDSSDLPPPIRAALSSYDPARGPLAYICSGTFCALPTGDIAEAQKTLKTIGRGVQEFTGP